MRLWLLRPVDAAPSASPARAICAMAALWLVVWVAIDCWQFQPEPRFFPDGIPLLAWYALAVVVLACVLRWRSRPAPAFTSVLALTLGAVPAPLLVAGMAGDDLSADEFLGASLLVGIYTLLYLARGLRAVTGRPQRAAACAGLLFIAAFVWLTDALDAIPDVWSPREAQSESAAAARRWMGRRSCSLRRRVSTSRWPTSVETPR